MSAGSLKLRHLLGLEKVAYALQDALGDIAAAAAGAGSGWHGGRSLLYRDSSKSFAAAARANPDGEAYPFLRNTARLWSTHADGHDSAQLMADAAQLGVGALAPVGDSVKRRMLTPVLSNSGAFIASEIMRALSRNRKINPGYHAAAGALGALSGRLALRGIDALQADPGGALS